MLIIWKFLISIKNSSEIGSKALPFHHIRTLVKTLEKNLPKEEHDALKIFLKNNDIIAQKARKGNTVAILNRKDYVCKMKNILKKSFI